MSEYTPLRPDTDEEIEDYRLDVMRKWDDREKQENPGLFHSGTHGYHEALDRSALIMDILDRNLCHHPSILMDPVAYKMAHKAFEHLYDLYQYLGHNHL